MVSDDARDTALVERTALLNARAPVGERMAIMMAVSGVGGKGNTIVETNTTQSNHCIYSH